jgi:hypothetical protein
MISKDLKRKINRLQKESNKYKINDFKDVILWEANGNKLQDAIRNGIVSPKVIKMLNSGK